MQVHLHYAGTLSFEAMRAMTQVIIKTGFYAERRCTLAALAVYAVVEIL
jgi:hypothetical protein